MCGRTSVLVPEIQGARLFEPAADNAHDLGRGGGTVAGLRRGLKSTRQAECVAETSGETKNKKGCKVLDEATRGRSRNHRSNPRCLMGWAEWQQLARRVGGGVARGFRFLFLWGCVCGN